MMVRMPLKIAVEGLVGDQGRTLVIVMIV